MGLWEAPLVVGHLAPSWVVSFRQWLRQAFHTNRSKAWFETALVGEVWKRGES